MFAFLFRISMLVFWWRKIFLHAPRSQEIKDRSLVYAIFSGLLLCCKSGTTLFSKNIAIKYEEELVQSFVNTARQNKDPAHICRALAAQALSFAGKEGQLLKALETQHKLESLYSAEDHSELVSQVYGSDRAAQSYGVCALWYDLLGMETELKQQIDYVILRLLPKMDPKNVHNSFMLLFPVLCCMKKRGLGSQAKAIFNSQIVQKFDKYYGEGKSTFFLPMYKSVEVLFGLAGGEWLSSSAELINWALKPETGSFSYHMESGAISIGRDGKGVVAEICLLLAKHQPHHDSCIQRLVEKSIRLVQESLQRFGRIRVNEFANEENQKVLAALLNFKSIRLN